MKVPMNKKNKQKWIFGRGAQSDRDIHWPPVVPWINNQLHDEIVELFMDAIVGERSQFIIKIQELEQQKARLESNTFLSPVQRRQLEKIKRELLRSQEADTSVQRKEAERQAKMLDLMRGVREVRVETVVPTRIASPCIVLNTSPIAINGVVLGTYDVWFHPMGKVPSDALFLRRRDNITEQGPHPHWNGYGCFGTYGPVFQRLLSQKQFGTLLGMFMQYLAIYDAGSPLIRLSEFEERAWQNENPLA